jgi:hypothetical protein
LDIIFIEETQRYKLLVKKLLALPSNPKDRRNKMKSFDPQKEQDKKQAYESPQIIYEGKIGTRAGSPLSNPSSVDDIDPADLFGD